MQVSVETISELDRRLTVHVPAEQVNSEINVRTFEILQKKRFDGFRPGKIPRHLVEQKHGLEIRENAISKVIEKTLPLALKQVGLEPLSRPSIEKVENLDKPGQDVIYAVNFEVHPEFSLPDFQSMQVKQYQVEITEMDIDKALLNVRNQMATFVPVEREARNGDRLTVDYTSLLNGKPYENSSNKGVTVELGTNAFIEGFESGLLGALSGDTRELNLVFPADWRIETLAGQPVQFSVYVQTVSEKQLVELDAAFADKIGADGPDLEAIRRKMRLNLEKQVEHGIAERTKKQIFDQLLEQSVISLPKSLIGHEMALLHEDLHRQMGDKAHDACHHHGLEEEAKQRVKLSLILQKIVKLENITPDQDKVREKISHIARSFGNAELVESMYYESEKLLAGVQNAVVVDQIIQWILKKSSVVLEPSTVDSLLEKRAV